MPCTHQATLTPAQTPEAAAIIEETIRFSILTEHEMCGEADAQGAGDTEAFSSHLNVEQMTKARWR